MLALLVMIRVSVCKCQFSFRRFQKICKHFHYGLKLFFTMAANDRGYGHGRFAGVFAVAQRQSECGRKTCKVHVSQPVTIGVC